jgi:cytochrome o ubiquinol oxidase subunit 1
MNDALQPAPAGAWSAPLGRFGWQDLPFVRAWQDPTANELIAAAAALMVVLGAVAVLYALTRHRLWRTLWSDWLTSLDHKKIGIMYIAVAFVMLSRAVAEAVLMRMQQASAVGGPGIVSADHFAQLFSTHGTIMIFFMAMPFLTGLINYVLPLQIGARDMAFPWANSIALWLTAGAAGLMMASLVVGRFSTGGWTGYPPYTGRAFSPDVGPDYWIWAVALASIGTTIAGINIACTIFKFRAPGMGYMRMPLFCWTSLCTAILMVFATPPLTVATALLALDRYLGFHFFTNELGGNVMNYANLFWLFGHPEVYILILPAFGVYSEVVSTFSTKQLYGYASLVAATMVIAVLSFTVWVHHFFTMGQSSHINAVFGIATMTIGVPTGVKIYDWIWTMFRGEVRFTVPMLYSLAFMMTFVIGGFTGIILAIPSLDYMVHNTVFLVAHFHNMLIPGLLYGMLAGYTYWFPKAFGFRLDERWGRIACGCWVLGFYLAFMPLYVLGASGMVRRTSEILNPAFRPWLHVALAGALVLLAALGALFAQLWVSIRDRERNRVFAGDPWDGRSLEWATSAPPPAYNFATLPQVKERDDFYAAKRRDGGYREADRYEAIEVPRNSMGGPAIGLSAAAAAFGLVWQIGWLAIAGAALMAGWLVARSFVRDTERTIPAAEVEATERRWHAALRAARPAPRQQETEPCNQGLAETAA